MKNRKAEIVTLLALGLIILGGVLAIGSSVFLSQQKTTSTRAAGCGSGGRFDCNHSDINRSICTTKYLEFACCVKDNYLCGGEPRYRWYGCTGQPCANTGINNSYHHLFGCPSGVNQGNPESCERELTSTQLPTPPPSSGSCIVYNLAADCASFCSGNHPGWSCEGGNACCPPTTPSPSTAVTPVPTTTIICGINKYSCGLTNAKGESLSVCAGTGKVGNNKNYYTVPDSINNKDRYYIMDSSSNQCLLQTFEEVKDFCGCGTIAATPSPGTTGTEPSPTTPPNTTATPVPSPTMAVSGGCNDFACSNNSQLQYSINCANPNFGGCGGSWNFYPRAGCSGKPDSSYSLENIKIASDFYCANSLRDIALDITLKAGNPIPVDPGKPNAAFWICFVKAGGWGNVPYCPVEESFDLTKVGVDGHRITKQFVGSNRLTWYLTYKPANKLFSRTLSGSLTESNGKITGDIILNQ